MAYGISYNRAHITCSYYYMNAVHLHDQHEAHRSEKCIALPFISSIEITMNQCCAQSNWQNRRHLFVEYLAFTDENVQFTGNIKKRKNIVYKSYSAEENIIILFELILAAIVIYDCTPRFKDSIIFSIRHRRWDKAINYAIETIECSFSSVVVC